MGSSSRSLNSVPLELLQEISSHLEPHDVGSLRLTSVACSHIAMQYMLCTLPIYPTSKGVARVLAICQSPGFSGFVHKLLFSTHMDIDGYVTQPMLKEQYLSFVGPLTAKYASTSFDGRDEGLHLYLPCSQCHHKTCPSDQGVHPSAGSARQCPKAKKEGGEFMVHNTVMACAEQLPKLQEVCMLEGGLLYTWNRSTDLSISIHGRNKLFPYGNLDGPGTVENWLEDLGAGDQVKNIRLALNFSLLSKLRLNFIRNALDDLRSGDKVKSLSLMLSFDRPTNVYSKMRKMANGQIYHAVPPKLMYRTLLESYRGLEEVKVRLPYLPSHPRITKRESLSSLYRHYPLMIRGREPPSFDDTVIVLKPVEVPGDLFKSLSTNCLRKVDMGQFSISRGGIVEMLRPFRATLRELKLTRIDFSNSRLVDEILAIRFTLRHLKNVEFHGMFRETWRLRSIDMDAFIEQDDLIAKAADAAGNKLAVDKDAGGGESGGGNVDGKGLQDETVTVADLGDYDDESGIYNVGSGNTDDKDTEKTDSEVEKRGDEKTGGMPNGAMPTAVPAGTKTIGERLAEICLARLARTPAGRKWSALVLTALPKIMKDWKDMVEPGRGKMADSMARYQPGHG